MQIVRILSSYKRDIKLTRKFYKSGSPFLKMLHFRMLYYFNIVILFTKHRLIFTNDIFCFFFVSGLKCARKFDGHASRKRDKTIRVRTKQFFVYARFIIISLQVRGSGKLYKVLIPYVVLGKYGEM